MPTQRFGRLRHVKRLFLGIWLVLAVPWTLFCTLVVIRDEFLPVDQRAKWETLTLLPHWPLSIWVIGSLVLLLIGLFEGSYREHRKVEGALDLQKSVASGLAHSENVALTKCHATEADCRALASMLATYEHTKKETYDILLDLAEKGRALRNRWVQALDSLGASFRFPMLGTAIDTYNEWVAECQERLKPPRVRYPDYNRILDKRPIIPVGREAAQVGAAACADLLLSFLDQQIRELDGLMATEFTPPHAIFFGTESWDVALKYPPEQATP